MILETARRTVSMALCGGGWSTETPLMLQKGLCDSANDMMNEMISLMKQQRNEKGTHISAMWAKSSMSSH